MLILGMCMLWLWWRCGQACAGLGELRSPAVRSLICRGGVVVALLWRCIHWNDYACDNGVVADNNGDVVCQVAWCGGAVDVARRHSPVVV